ncbi:CLUMA_CG016084, isoform A [Clunio marinus]|uniref:CLUMA_CG016084, isoform A n=1 Tax=Clunio marinus TaxID=568069 RepID=A0A1J1IQS3_9DIPT|nr:CLUMA_CG016084, isoform A [Clunio marinus]
MLGTWRMSRINNAGEATPHLNHTTTTPKRILRSDRKSNTNKRKKKKNSTCCRFEQTPIASLFLTVFMRRSVEK